MHFVLEIFGGVSEGVLNQHMIIPLTEFWHMIIVVLGMSQGLRRSL